MIRPQSLRLLRVSTRPLTKRSFTISAIRAGEGDTGAQRSGGMASSDSFTKREQASENLFIRQKEMESLRKLKEKLQTQRAHLDELDKHIAELEKDSGGEHH